ncbi:glycoside hydrolase family 78 protein [Bacillus solitudinis]|uniref:glycoside hydrolase family 78 protein n=1 Tax=Bacillus solitudinis TaxID=2014074 RepID=UPI000C24B271|nr:glycoside hydrolase family 78 protein [Bacillus solitudinis]
MYSTGLKTNTFKNPLGIDSMQPHFSWVLTSSERAQIQTAYQIMVATSYEELIRDNADMWDSGKEESSQSVQISYQGKKLQSGAKYYWKVKVWDKNHQSSPWSEPAFWTMGLLSQSEWEGKWIGAEEKTRDSEKWMDKDLEPSLFLRKTFSTNKMVESATAHVTALGVYEFHINEKRVEDAYFAPGFTDYNLRLQYQMYDVTELLQAGENAVGALLGTGWYAGYVGMLGKNVYGEQPFFQMQLNITYKDGTVERIVTDESWRVTTGPILYSDIIKGEYYDARLELSGWNSAKYDDSSWEAPLVKDDYEGELVSQIDPPVRITENLTPVSVSTSPSGTTIFDLGQNMIGWAKLKVSGREGTKVTVRYAEMLQEDGSLYTENLRKARPEGIYILKGNGVEVFEPHFTFHGFRFVEVICEGEPLTSVDIEGRVVHSDTPVTGMFETSDEMVNKLYQNITWGQRGNFLSIPTDCPQRDERLGWTGDAQIFIRTASYNMDVANFFRKFTEDLVDAQLPSGAFTDIVPDAGWINLKRKKYNEKTTILTDVIHPIENWLTDANAGWGDAGVVVPWTVYLVYGDRHILETHYKPMSRWIDYLVEHSTNYIRPDDTVYGDWLAIDEETPKDVLATAYFAYSVEIMAKVAAALGKTEEEHKYKTLFEKIKKAFNETFVTEDGKVKGETQTGYVLALNMNLLTGEKKKKASQHLVNNIKRRNGHLSTGFLGVGYLLPVLTDNGYLDVAYSLLKKDTFPSWLYSVKHGATTIWERWDGWTAHKGFQSAQMNSFNHYSLGSVGEWMYRYVAGIDVKPEGAGFKQITIHPRPGGGLTFAKGHFESVHGQIRSEWTLENGRFTCKVRIPVNTTATVHIPGKLTTQLGSDVLVIGTEEGTTVYEVGSGDYDFESVMETISV